MPSLVKWRPETKQQRVLMAQDKFWHVVKQVGEFMLIVLPGQKVWIQRNQVTEWRFV